MDLFLTLFRTVSFAGEISETKDFLKIHKRINKMLKQRESCRQAFCTLGILTVTNLCFIYFYSGPQTYMAHFVIAGKPDCPAFVHGVYVARYLQEHLPNFNAHIIQKRTGDWEPWLEDIVWKHKWNHHSSPIIWKELSMRGGVAHYVGGLSEFWEYCFDYYGLQSIIAPNDLLKMVEDNLQFFEEEEKIKAENSKNIRYIGIIGLVNHVFPLLLIELLGLQELQKPGGMKITLYDVHREYSQVCEYVHDLIKNIEHLTPFGDRKAFEVVEAMRDVLPNCELLIVLGDFSKKSDEMQTDWLVRNMSVMFMLADVINAFAKRNLRVVLAMDGPVCYNATLLMETCTAIRIQNIVAVSSDIGLGPLHYAAQQAKVPLSSIGAPPVWGFIGINQFVDLQSAIISCDIYRPYQRVLRNKGGSTLPLGVIQPELRFMAYLLDDLDQVWGKVAEAKKTIKQQLLRPSTYAKIRATISLLKLWFAKEPSDDIISLGVCSNGSHGIPASLVFSQPVELKNNLWVPFSNFPVTEKTLQEIQNLIPFALEITERISTGTSTTNNPSIFSNI